MPAYSLASRGEAVVGHSRKALEEAHNEAGGADDGGGCDVAPAEEGGAETIVHWRHTGASWCRDVHTHTQKQQR